jgi:hypothetical protein
VVLPKTHFSLKKQQVLCGFAQNTIFIKKTTGSLWFCLKHNFLFKKKQVLCGFAQNTIFIKKTTGSLWFCPKHNFH